MKNLFLLFLLLTFAGTLSAQVPKMDNVLYGAAYYQEYMPTDRLAEDLKLMKESGMSVVRLGESTWSLFEPREGEFEFAWMDDTWNSDLFDAGLVVAQTSGGAGRLRKRAKSLLRNPSKYGHHQSNFPVLF